MHTFALSLLSASSLLQGAPGGEPDQEPERRPPNVVLVFTDDQGFGDLGCYGADDIPTPHIDRLASEGLRFTDFLVSQAVCSASRASLLTGCYAERVGVQGALGAGARVGLNPAEETLAELLQERGFATGIFGKWHLGHQRAFLPLSQGFDEYFGLPYSNDMWPVGYDGVSSEAGHKASYPGLFLYEGDEPVEPVETLEDQGRLTLRYTERAVDFIERHADEPFFLYLPHSMPHVPLGVSEQREGRTERGPFGDVIAELDDSVGQVLAALEQHDLVENTLVIFASDNGPWLNYGDHAGSTGGLREGKGTAFEGGVRVPCVVRLPGTIPAGATTDQLAATIDLLPTIAALTGARLPELPIDGVDLTPLLVAPEARDATPVRRDYWYYYGRELCAVRRDQWKLVLPHTYRSYGGVEPGTNGFPGPYAKARTGLALYDLATDRGETTDVAAAHPELVAELEALAERARADLGDRQRGLRGAGARPLGRLDPLRSSPVEHLAVGATATLADEPHPKYAAAGAATVTDGVLGSEDFTDGTWLGYEATDFEAVVDLGESRSIQRLACSFLQDQSSWIFLPAEVELALSADGVTFQPVAEEEFELTSDLAQRTATSGVRFEARTARFVRVRAASVATCPPWHRGAGGKAWLFVDELVVE
ncbi:MAG: sulfatase-like hydrolase/transferase [Planctomycetota bacterium]|nr:sulfatase-like hydrolase/transferase [Planctomycetota bacterium]